MSIDSVLERLQDISGLTFSSFLALHLASPIAAAFVSSSGSEPLASNIQLATRVVYQDGRAREMVVVWTSLGTHICIGIIRRITRVNRQRLIRARLEADARRAEPEAAAGDRYQPVGAPTTLRWLRSYLPKTAHAIAAYIGLPFLVDHIISHRLSSSPSNRSYQFVAHSLHRQPILAYLKYGALVASLTFHALVGIHKIQAKYLSPRGRGRKGSVEESQRSTAVRLAWLGIIGTVGVGIRKISREEIPPWLARRYK